MNISKEEVALKFALALATRPHTSYDQTIPAAFDAAEYFFKELDKRQAKQKNPIEESE